MTPMADLEGRVAMVVGGATELESAVVRALLDAGCEVVRCSPVGGGDASAPDAVHRLEFGRLTDRSAAQLVSRAKSFAGRLDILVQHHPTVHRRLATGLPLHGWSTDLNALTDTFVVARAFAGAAEPHGSIAHIASIDLAQAYPGRITASVVANGLVGLSRALAVEWATRPIRVNVIAPGVMLADEDGRAIASGQQSLDRVMLRAPGHRLGTAEETAAVVLFLVSQRASFITGQTIWVDGGWSSLTQHAEGLRFP